MLRRRITPLLLGMLLLASAYLLKSTWPYKSLTKNTTQSTTKMVTIPTTAVTTVTAQRKSINTEKFFNFTNNLANPRKKFEFTITPWSIFSAEIKNPIDVRWSMVVMVKSHSKNFQQRKTIRQSWAREKLTDGVRMVTLFIVGKEKSPGDGELIAAENKTFGDILKMDMKEEYKNIGYKTLAGMQYVGDHFSDDWMYTSADDDIVPDLKRMRKKVEETVGMNQTDAHICELTILCGHGCVPEAYTKRNERNKWFLSKTDYPLATFPPYCAGAWYTMRWPSVKRLYDLSRSTPFFWIDDVWITGILRVKYFATADPSCYINDLNAGLPVNNSESFVRAGRFEHAF